MHRRPPPARATTNSAGRYLHRRSPTRNGGHVTIHVQQAPCAVQQLGAHRRSDAASFLESTHRRINSTLARVLVSRALHARAPLAAARGRCRTAASDTWSGASGAVTTAVMRFIQAAWGAPLMTSCSASSAARSVAGATPRAAARSRDARAGGGGGVQRRPRPPRLLLARRSAGTARARARPGSCSCTRVNATCMLSGAARGSGGEDTVFVLNS
jgi:hypothetical protein